MIRVERKGLRGLLPVTEDAGFADWVIDGVRPSSGYTVGSLVTGGFESHARLFHPAYLGASGREVGWAAIAEANRRQAHAGMQWPGVSGFEPFAQPAGQDGLWDEEPSTGSLPAPQAARLIAVLARHTSAADCFYAVWDGFGAPAIPFDGVVRVEMPGRSMVLLKGPLTGAATVSMETEPWQQSPSLWWPADRAWCVATDVDLMSTYIGGSRACVAELVADPGLEIRPVAPDHRVTLDSDTINAPPSPRRAW